MEAVCVTEDKSLGLVPPNTRKGDGICFIKGLQAPFVLSEKNGRGKQGGSLYELVGCCYIDDLMSAKRKNLEWEWHALE
jgi:hypothetical protein